jgi:hypothetical protein
VDPKVMKPRLVRELPEDVLEELPWPGLRARDRLSRVVTRAVKEGKEEKHRLIWTEYQMGRVLDQVSPKTALAIFFLELGRRGRRVPRIVYDLLDLF